MKNLINGLAKALSSVIHNQSSEDGLGVQPSKQSSVLAAAWRDRRLSSQSLAPGEAKRRADFDPSDPSDAMCSVEAGAWLTAAFGPAKSVGEPGAAARMHAIEFRGETILAIWQRERGVIWQVVLGEATDPRVDGRSYGKPMLLSWDKEVRDFWPDFCAVLGAAMREDPLAFKASMQARELAASTRPARGSVKGPRI